MSMKRQGGFTLLELVVSMIIFAILSGSLFSWMQAGFRSQEMAYRSQVLRDNLTIVKALRSHAANENNGFLVGAYTGGSYMNSPVDLGNAILLQYLARGEITSARYNDDGSTNQNVKYLDLIAPRLSYAMPIVGNSSETVTLSYDRGVLYQTQCGITETCNDGTPGTSAAFTATGWTVAGTDIMPVEITTLDLQQGAWRDTWFRLSELRKRIRDDFNAQVQATSDAATNHFFLPDLGTSPDLSGADPLTNQGCRNGWYQLNSVDVNVLAFYGLDPVSLYSQTAWGGRIEYCADYDPHNTGANVVPHVGALRINRNVTAGSAPSGTLANNLIIVI